jgi:hypothetical protein
MLDCDWSSDVCSSDLEAQTFTDYQAAFAARIRDPRGAPRPAGAPARRMRVYEELLFKNLEGFLLACYPITCKILGERAWRRTAKRFFAEHRSHSPWFRDIPKAFLDWLTPRASELFPTRPWLTAFMHYEWLELDVAIAPEDPDPTRIDPTGDLLTGRPVLAPGARLASYAYPVHCIGPGWRGQAESAPLHYLLYRDAAQPEADRVRFILLNPLSARLAALLQTHSCTGRKALERLALEIPPATLGLDLETFITAGHGLLRKLLAQGALLGVSKNH